MNFKPFKIGKYLLLERLATGGMAEVYRAKASGAGGFEKQLAIKRIIPTYSENEEFRRMFEYEARLSSLLNHANIVHVYDFVKSGDTYLLAMEFVDGKNLRQVVNKAKKTNTLMPIGFSVYVINEVAKGLDYAHKMRDGYQGKSLNVIHRDMSPQNIMLGYEGAIKIVDFGIAKARDRVDETRSGVIKGKFGYMSPEQASGEEIDHRSDIFSTVIILYELVTGKRLFAAENDMATLKRIQECIIQRPSLVNPKVNEMLEKIILKGLTKEKDLRYQQAGELHQKLQEYLNKYHPTITQNTVAQMMNSLFFQEIRQEKKRLEKVYQESIPYSQGERKPLSDEIDGIGQMLDGELTKSEMNPDSLVTKVSNVSEVSESDTAGEPSEAKREEKQSLASQASVTPGTPATPAPSAELSASVPTAASKGSNNDVSTEAEPRSPAVEEKKGAEDKQPEERTFVPSIELPFHPDTSASQEKTAFAPSVPDDLFTRSTIAPEPESEKKVTEEKKVEEKKDLTKTEASVASYAQTPETSSFGLGQKSFSLVTEAKHMRAKEPENPSTTKEDSTQTKHPGPSENISSESTQKDPNTATGSITQRRRVRRRPPPRPVRATPNFSRSLATILILSALIGGMYIYLSPTENGEEVFPVPRSTSNLVKDEAPPIAPNTSCAVRFDSDPKGAEIKLNDKIVGRTPTTAFAKCLEYSNIQYTLPGYLVVQENLKIERPNQLFAKKLKRAPVGRVQFTLSHNANFYVNGILQSVTVMGGRPFTIVLEANKVHRLQFVNTQLGISASKDYQVSSGQILRDRVILRGRGKAPPRQPTSRKKIRR